MNVAIQNKIKTKLMIKPFATSLERVATRNFIEQRCPEKPKLLLALFAEETIIANISISLINLATKFHFSSDECPEGDQNNFRKLISPIKCSIAVKELIIEWEDYQTEACCYVQCDGIKDQRDHELDINGTLIKDESRPKTSKPLLSCFYAQISKK